MSAHTPGLKQRYSCGCETRLGMASMSLIHCPVHAAAPDLLKALEAILTYGPPLNHIHDSMARAAIAKARGSK